MKRIWLIVGAILLLLVVGGGIFWFLRSQSQVVASSSPISFVPTAQGPQGSGEVTTISGYLSYSNQQYHFALEYPPNLQVTMHGGGGDALTVVFHDPTTNEGFQVFVTPYDQTQITKDRFNEDEPSGVLENPTTIVVDGAQAVMFYSTNQQMGDTREVWFIQGGLLYEVTTYKQLDQWLSDIMQTWQFI